MLLFMAFVLGACVGSFINVVVIRLAAGEKLTGRSYCRQCGRQLAWQDNIPLWSFLRLRGRCAYCGSRISWQYPLVELASSVMFVIGVILMPPADWRWLVTYFILSFYALVLFVFDVRFKVLPDIITLSGIVILFGLNLWRGQPWSDLLLAAIVGAGFFGLQYVISRGRWIGAGDIRLGALMGVSLGWPAMLIALVLAYWLGALVGLSLILVKGYKLKSELPFGAFLTVSMIIVFWWSERMIEWYGKFMGYN